MNWLGKLVVNKTFLWSWIGVLFATYGGMVYGLAPQQFFNFSLGFMAVAVSGYSLGRVTGFQAADEVVDHLIAANKTLANALVEAYERLSDEPPHDDGTACREE